jgi:serine phosphatase RsbU (regulator of sigma subunit)
MMLVYVRAVFRQAVRETHDPRAIVSRLADAVFVETHGEAYLTCIVGRLDEETRQLTVTTAGHPPALVTGATFRRLTRGGPPAGLFPHADYDEETVDLAPGSRVLFVTDGITERLSGGLEGAIAQLDSHGSAEDLCTAVFRLSEGPEASPPVPGWDDDRTAVVLAIDSEETMWRRAAQQWPIIREVGCS